MLCLLGGLVWPGSPVLVAAALYSSERGARTAFFVFSCCYGAPQLRYYRLIERDSILRENDTRHNTQKRVEPARYEADFAGMLENNRAVRAGGEFLERAGRIARPVGLVVDSVNDVGAIRQDGGIGENTGRTVTGIAGGAAGGLAGAKAGAAIGATIGSVVPGVGTAAGAVVGGVVAGIAGAIGGDNLATSAFNTVKRWFD